MLQDFFINTIMIESLQEQINYKNGKAEKQTTLSEEVKCRVSSLNTKDLRLLDDTADVNISTRKLYTNPDCGLKIKDYVLRQGNRYQVIYAYAPQDKTGIHHKKFYIRLVE